MANNLTKMTTMELVNEYIDVHQWMSNLSLLEPDPESAHSDEWQDDFNNASTSLKNVQRIIREKITKVDKFVVNLSKKEHLIDAEIEAYKDEIDRLKNRKSSLEGLKKFFNEYLLPIVVMELGKDGVWETNIARYKLYETYGGVDIDPDVISDDYKKVEIKESIDRAKARKIAMSHDKAGKELPAGITIKKIKRVRRS